MALALRGASREALAATRERLATELLDRGSDPLAIGDELFSVLDLLGEQPRLRRTLSDPSRSADGKAQFVRSLLGSQVSEPTVAVLEAAVRGRWSSPSDFQLGLERLAVEATVGAAEREGRLDDLEDELFRFVRIVDATPQLRQALAERGAPESSREALLQSLLGGRTTEATQRLVRQATRGQRARNLDVVLRDYGQVAADRRSRLVARVRTAVPLGDDERRRLASSLARVYGSEVHLDTVVDPQVLGGLEVTVAGELVDGTVASRLDGARRRLAG
jgi:F-type H+-transporting ATPase subunit delta